MTLTSSRGFWIALALATTGCATEAVVATTGSETRLVSSAADTDPAHDFVGAMEQICNPDGTARNLEANAAGCERGDVTCDTFSGGACGRGAGVLITPSLVAYSHFKYFIDFSPNFLMRYSVFPQQGALADPDVRGNAFVYPWTVGPEPRTATHDDIHGLVSLRERRRSRVGLYCPHPHTTSLVDSDPHVPGQSDFMWTYVIPEPALRGTPLATLYDLTSDQNSPALLYGSGITWDLFVQICGDPLDADDGPATDLALFGLASRVAPELGGPSAARPVFRLADGRTDPAHVAGTVVQMYDYGQNDFTPNWGVRTTGTVALSDGLHLISALPLTGIQGARYRTATGAEFRVLGGITNGLPNPSGGSGDPLILVTPVDQGVHGRATLISTTAHAFLGDEGLREWLDPDGDGYYLGELDAWDGLGGPMGPNDPSHCIDVDGDCLGNNDNCDAVSNIDQLDTDGDGIGDACDLCPLTWEPLIHQTSLGTYVEPALPLREADRQFYPAATCIAVRANPGDSTDPSWHPRNLSVAPGDVVGVACGEPGNVAHVSRSAQFLRVTNDLQTLTVDEAASGIDQNHDGVVDATNDFPGTDLPNYDGDGIPYLCDNCPDVPNPPDPTTGRQADCDGDGEGDACSHFGDSDGDGIPNNCDMCPFVADSLFDCNSDAELARADALRTSVDPRLSRTDPIRSDACDLTPCAAITPSTTAGVPIATGTTLITTAHLRGSLLVAGPTVDAPPASAFTTTGRVGFRFCRCGVAAADDEQTRNACADARTGDCRIRAASPITGDEVDLYTTDPDGAWRTITLQAIDGTPVTEYTSGQFHRLTGTPDPAHPDLDLVWPFLTDPAALPLTGPPGPPSAQGVLWSQVRGTPACGMDIFGNPNGDGTLCGHLAAHYWSGLVAGGTVTGPNPHVAAGLGLIPWPAPQRVCTYCAGSFPGAFLGNVCADPSACGIDSWVLRTDRIELAAAPQLSLAMSKTILDPLLTWTVASEQAELLDGGIPLVGISLGQPVARVTAVGSTLGLVEEVGQKIGKPPQETLSSLATAFAATGNPNPTGRGAILLGREGRLFQVGGDLVERQDVVVTDLVSGTQTPIHLEGDRPGVVLAATHRLTSASALVLDRVPPVRRRHRYDRGYHDDREHVRLLLIDLRQSTSRVVATFPWLDRFDRFALVTLDGGDTVLVASTARGHRHQLYRFRVSAGHHGELRADVLATAEGRGEIVAPPIASRSGVSLAVRPPGRGWIAVGYDLPLPRHGAGHHLDECF